MYQQPPEGDQESQ